jgi:hypothetical protein
VVPRLQGSVTRDRELEKSGFGVGIAERCRG